MLQKHLYLRGNIYYFRWRIPADLHSFFGVTEVTHSLRTSDHMLAIVRAGRLTQTIGEIKRVRLAYFALELDFDEYVSEIKQHWAYIRYMTRRKAKKIKKTETIKTGLITAGGMMFDFDGDVDKELGAVAKAKEMGLLSQDAKLNQFEGDNVTGPLFSQVFHDFLKHKTDPKEAVKDSRDPLSKKQQENHKRNFEKLVGIMGDLPIDKIKPKLLKTAILTCALLPRMNIKRYKQKQVSELLEMEIPEVDRVAGKTVIEVRKTAQGIFTYAVDVAELIEFSPTTGMKLGAKINSACTFAAYTDEEVRLILISSSKENKSWRRWLPMLAAYTGGRRTELVQLRKQDIKLDVDSGRYYILITNDAGSVKTENAIRQIPLHATLIDNGFLEFVENAKGRLFDNLDPQSVTKWFTSFRDRLGIERFDDFGKRKVFHSFRHSFITKSRNGNSLDHVQQVVGHEKTSAGETDRYSHRQPLSAVLDVVDKVNYG